MIEYDFDLVKLKDYKNVTTYSFTIKYHDIHGAEDVEYSIMIWFDRNHYRYCGGHGFGDYYQMPLSIDKVTEADKKYYDYIKDLYIDIINDEMNDYSKSLDDYIEFREFNIGRYIHYIYSYDKEFGDELKSRYRDLINRQNEYTNNEQIRNQRLLIEYSSPIWQISYLNRGNIWRGALPLKGGLPKTEKELGIYLDWLAENRDKYIDETSVIPLPLKDIYGEPLKFTLEKDGLRVSSAGLDKIWGTADDQTYLSKYSEINVLLDINKLPIL